MPQLFEGPNGNSFEEELVRVLIPCTCQEKEVPEYVGKLLGHDVFIDASLPSPTILEMRDKSGNMVGKIVHEPKPECDHILGYESDEMNINPVPIRQSDERWITRKTVKEFDLFDEMTWCDHCSNCGEKLNLPNE